MKRSLYRIALSILSAAAILACQRTEIEPSPSLKVTDDSDAAVLELGQSLEYLMDLAYFQYSTAANNNNEVLKATKFTVRSNCSWKLVPVGEEPEWIHPFPDHGDDDGNFCFLVERNNSQSDSRQVIYKMVLNDGAKDIEIGGDIIVTQAAAADFLKLGSAKVEVNKEGGNASVTVTSNVPWTYSLVPNEDFASPAIEEWIEDRTELAEGEFKQTLKFRFGDNSDGSIRGATLFITVEGHDDLSKEIPITQYGVDVEVSGFPVEWPSSAGNTNYPKWPSATNAVPTVLSTVGTGTITFVRADVPGIDRTASTTDCSGGNARVNGAWPGDYYLFYVPVAVSAGSLIKLQFEGRVSGSGIKHWRLEYLDGGEWKIAGTPLTADLEADSKWPAETITYTHDMSPGGTGVEYNKIISQVVRYENTCPEVAFRFMAASNVICSSGARMANPTTASARLSNSGADGCDASISCVASGGDIKYADISVTGLDKDYILFEGSPAAPATFVVTASDDFTVTTDVDWLHVGEDCTTGTADEATSVSVSCDPSTLSEAREGNITILAGVTRKVISVIQSAAGQELDPFISISSGNSVNAKADGGTTNIKVQANVEFEAVSDVPWITLENLGTKAMVEWTTYAATYQANDSGAARTGTVRFFNTEKNIEAVVIFNQAYEEAPDNNDLIQWGFAADLMGAYKDSFEKDNAFDANIAGKGTLSWYSLPENVAADTENKKSHLIGTTGQPYVTGVWPGDYWEFSIPVSDVPAGTVVNFSGLSRSSATGMKYWRMEWSVDGTTWTPVKELQTETESGTSGKYTNIMTSSDQTVSESFSLTGAVAKGTLKIRFTCAANWTCGNAALTAPNGGTHRWSGAAANNNCVKITIEKPHEPLHAEWLFNAAAMADSETGYAATFGGTTQVNVKEAGDGGLYVNSNVKPGGKIRYFQVDKTAIDTEGKAARLVGSTGHPFVYGAWPGDYWLFEASDGYTYKAGTKVHIKFITRISATGHKYWKLEYWDGAAWQPVSALKDGEVGEGEAHQTFQYNFEPTTASSNTLVDFTWTLAADCDNMQFRYTCMADYTAGNAILPAPNGGTCRIAGAEGTSPIFEVVTE